MLAKSGSEFLPTNIIKAIELIRSHPINYWIHNIGEGRFKKEIDLLDQTFNTYLKLTKSSSYLDTLIEERFLEKFGILDYKYYIPLFYGIITGCDIEILKKSLSNLKR
ncbi:hypothetical protein [Thalassobacillus sp. C254]|uniref:hypothetical protein n=1 Tax=Thalassobacillus sp. C254 TaxID=1225341 RepID=UPI0012ED559A|nr:hypothetical protein [Thalassobacillus sp. C254]